MLPFDTSVSFFLAALLLALAPGPDNIFVLTQSAAKGRTAGFAVTLGLCTGLLVHTAAVAFGVALLIQTSIIAFTAIKLFGGGYLLFLAWRAFTTAAEPAAVAQTSEISTTTLYRRGIIMNVSNPKVAIFFLAFLPQFTDPARGPLAVQLVMLGGLFIVATIIVFGGVAVLAGTLGEWLNRTTRMRRLMNRATGAIFVCLALKLLTTRQ